MLLHALMTIFHWHKNQILNRYSAFYEGLVLDFDLMRKAAALILETTDFKALCKQPDAHDNTFCQISKCDLFVNEEEGRLRFTITGNRFLRGMVRICVFFLLEVGSGKMTLKEFESTLNLEKELKEKVPTLPNGLFLSKVDYPFLELDESHNMIKLLKAGLE